MSGYSINRIPENLRVFNDTTVIAPAWDSNQMETFAPTSSFSRYDNIGSIKCRMASFTNPWVRYDASVGGVAESITTLDENGDLIEAFVWVKSTFPITINAAIDLEHLATSTHVVGETVSTRVDSPDWTLVRCGAVEIPNSGFTYTTSIDIKFAGFNQTLAASNFFYISFPVIYSQSEFLANPSLMDIFLRLPEMIRESSLNEDLPSLSFIRFIEVMCSLRGSIFETISQITPRDISEGYDPADDTTKSILVDADVVSRRFAFWLAQFVGTRLINPQVSATPWGNMPSTWQGIDLIDSINTSGDAVAWQELQDFLPEIFGLDEYYRWQIDTAYHGYAAGTIGAIKGAIQRVLTGTKEVNLTFFTPFTCLCTTKKSETPGSQLISIGSPVPEIVDIIEVSRPAGLVVTHQLIA